MAYPYLPRCSSSYLPAQHSGGQGGHVAPYCKGVDIPATVCQHGTPVRSICPLAGGVAGFSHAAPKDSL